MRPVFVDADGDSYGGHDSIGRACSAVAGESFLSTDCWDENSDVHPAADELCDLVDNNCNGFVDEGFPVDEWFPDVDQDGFGEGHRGTWLCRSPGPGFVSVGGDCNDADPAMNPGMPETCNGQDNDCDGLVNEGDPDVPTSPWWRDNDDDGFGDPDVRADRCRPPTGFVDNDLDCNDGDPTITTC